MPPPSPLRPSDDELRRLYLDERLPARAIADRCKVRKITALRWLKAAGVERRATGVGLANRGVTAPTADELHAMVHIEHLSYRRIAERYGVDYTAVPYWLDLHAIPRPDPLVQRRHGRVATEPTEHELRTRIQHGESLTSIAMDFTVTRGCLRVRCEQYGITVRLDGWCFGKRFPCRDGHQARSTYEQRVDDWLTEHGLAHEVEPTYSWDRRYRADFLVGQTYIEVWGVTHNERYQQRKAMKIQRCRETGLDLVQINHWQFAKGRRWWRPLQQLEQALHDPGDRLFE